MYISSIYRQLIESLSYTDTANNNINARSKPGRDKKFDFGCGRSPADHCTCACRTQ